MSRSSSPRAADRDPRLRAIERVLYIELAFNIGIAAIKTVYGWFSGSLAIATDAVHSLVDGSANIIGLVLLRYAAAPADENHPYGHRKIEILAACGIGITIGYAAIRFTYSAVSALVSGAHEPTTSPLGFAVIALTMVVNIFVARYEARRARELASAYLAAEAAHTASDVVVTTAVLVSFAASHVGLGWADPIGALIVIVIIARVAWKILAQNLAILVDGAVIDTARVEAVVLAVPGVHGCHRIRSRGTRDAAQLDLHLLLGSDITLRHAHQIAHRVEHALLAELPTLTDVTIHMEPHDDPPEGL